MKIKIWRNISNLRAGAIWFEFHFHVKNDFIWVWINHVVIWINMWFHSHKKRKDSLETQAGVAVLRTYVENQAMLEPILLYRASNCKQTKEQDSEDCLWAHIFTFLWGYCQLFSFFLSRCKQNRMKLCYNKLQFTNV